MESNPVGRPSSFSQDIADRICEQIATSSKSLKRICEEEGMPTVRTVFNWINQGEREDSNEDLRRFFHQYARAKEQQADFLAEEILEIADDGTNDYMTIQKGDQSYNVEDKEVTNRSRLRVDARKWIASKLKPKKYAEKVDLNHSGDIAIKQITGMEVK